MKIVGCMLLCAAPPVFVEDKETEPDDVPVDTIWLTVKPAAADTPPTGPPPVAEIGVESLDWLATKFVLETDAEPE